MWSLTPRSVEGCRERISNGSISYVGSTEESVFPGFFMKGGAGTAMDFSGLVGVTTCCESCYPCFICVCVADGEGSQCRSSQQHGFSGTSVPVLRLCFYHSVLLRPVQPCGDTQQEQVLQPLLSLLAALEQQLRVRLQPTVPLWL